MQDATDFRIFAKSRCRVGESPVWDAAASRLFWCDCQGATIFEQRLGGKTVRHPLPENVGSLGLTDDGRLIVALASGVQLYSLEDRSFSPLAEPEPGHAARVPGDRLNDGKVGPDGAFWVGSMHKTAPTAGLFRVTGDGRSEVKVQGLSTANGLAFSADGRTMFLSDSRAGWIDCYDLEPATGDISNCRRIVHLTEAEGRPDGGATDLEGCYWSAGVSAGCLNRFSAAGELLARIELPVRRPTMVCFGGDDMRTMYITSIRRPDDAGAHCGDVITMRADVPGVPAHVFRTGAAA